MSNAKSYVLGGGGSHGRHEKDGFKVYHQGDTIQLTDEEAANPLLQGRLTPAADAKLAALTSVQANMEHALAALPNEVATAESAESEKVLPPPRVPSPPTSTVATTRDSTTAFLNDPKLSIEDVVDVISAIDDKAKLDLLREAEMSVDGGQRRSIVTNAISTRKRQLQMAVAIAAKKKKAEDRKAVIAANKAKAAASTTKAATKKGKGGKGE